jgi:molybdenum cofactor synthesis domain-containing protein
MIGIIIIGDELLSAQVEDQNLKYMLKCFSISGHVVNEVRFIGDNHEQIKKAFIELSSFCKYVISSGGVGPTHDDVTMLAVADAFNQPLYRNDYLEKSLRSYYGEAITSAALKMSDIPKNAVLIDTHKGRNWPIISVENCFILPGVPEIFRQKFESLLNYLPQSTRYFNAVFFLKSDEIYFAQELEDLQFRFKEIIIGSYPIFGRDDYSAQISIKHQNKSELEILYFELEALFIQKGILVQVTKIKEID